MTPPPADFVQLPSELFSRPDLTPADKLVFMAIRDRIGQNGASWPGQRRLAEDCGLRKSTVADAVARLEHLGLIQVDHVEGNPSGKTNRYRVVNASASRTPASRTPASRDRTPASRTEPDQENQTKKKEKKEGAAVPDPWTVAQEAMTGATLKTDAFKAAWSTWIKYQRQKHKTMTSMTIVEQIHELEGFGHDSAIASIKNSIRNGWQGLFKPDGGNGRSQAENPARVRREDDPYSARSEFFDNSAPHAGAGSAAVASA